MSVAPGQNLLHYQIIERIGAGGMGVVYKATDTKLRREVAIKVLPEDFAQDVERLARFEREAHVLAALNHPGIAAIYGFEETDGVRFLALELVPGETLAERLARGPLPLDEALRIATQIADALEEAHEQGIVHRDLKPANIKIDRSRSLGSSVKLLDFGLAKALEPVSTSGDSSADIADSPTTELDSRAGFILGTAGYMSPEQARGHRVDKRTDIWAFACVLYEMLTGKPTFARDNVSDTLAAILKEEPDWSRLPASTPGTVRRLLRRCLHKDPRRRLRDIGDARYEILDVGLHVETGTKQTASLGERSVWGRRHVLMLGITLASLGTALALWLREPPEQPPMHLALPLPLSGRIAGFAGNAMAISPDGSRLVYVVDRGDGYSHLEVRHIDERSATPLRGTEARTSAYYGHAPFFSPDGRQVGFYAEEQLKRIAIDGGSPIAICDAVSMWGGATWSEDGHIYFATSGTEDLQRVAETGGKPEAIQIQVPNRGESGAHEWISWPHALPGGTHLLLSIGSKIVAVELQTWRVDGLAEVQGGTRPLYSATGHLLIPDASGTVFAAPFDLKSLRVTGAMFPVLDDVRFESETGASQLDVARNGTVAYIPGNELSTLILLDRNGEAQPLLAEARNYQYPRISFDRSLVTTVVIDGTQRNIWVLDRARGTFNPLTRNGMSDTPVWFPSEHKVTFTDFTGDSFGLYSQAADGGDSREPVLLDPTIKIASSWSWDGGSLAYMVLHHQSGPDVWVLPPDEVREPVEFLVTPGSEAEPAFSPKGDYIAYTSDETGRNEVFVRPYPVRSGKWRISTDGGEAPRWARKDNRTVLLYRNGPKFVAVDVKTTPRFAAGRPEVLFELEGIGAQDYDVSPDGEELVAVRATSTASPQINVVVNWFVELRNRTADTP